MLQVSRAETAGGSPMPPIGMTIVDRYAIFEFWKGIASKRSIIEFFVGKQLSKIWGYLVNCIKDMGLSLHNDRALELRPELDCEGSRHQVGGGPMRRASL
jgi:hypothetical protein